MGKLAGAPRESLGAAPIQVVVMGELEAGCLEMDVLGDGLGAHTWHSGWS